MLKSMAFFLSDFPETSRNIVPLFGLVSYDDTRQKMLRYLED